MSNRHDVRASDTVNRSYEAVRAVLFAGPLSVFRQATMPDGTDDPARGVDLHAKAGPLHLSSEVIVEVQAIESSRSPDDEPATNFVLQWHAVKRPGWFPVMHATLTIYPRGAAETHLELSGTYEPPLGVVGDALDAIALHKVAQQSVEGFVRDVAGFLREPA